MMDEWVYSLRQIRNRNSSSKFTSLYSRSPSTDKIIVNNNNDNEEIDNNIDNNIMIINDEIN